MWKRQVEWKYNIEILTAPDTHTFALLYVYLWYFFFVRKRRRAVWNYTFRPRKYIYHVYVDWLLYGTRKILADKRARILRAGEPANFETVFTDTELLCALTRRLYFLNFLKKKKSFTLTWNKTILDTTRFHW